MEILNIENNNNVDLLKIKDSGYYHHLKDINDENILQLIVVKVSEDKTKIHFETINKVILDINVIYKNEGQKLKRITQIEKKETISRVPKRVIERQNLPKFGNALLGNAGYTRVTDMIEMDTDFHYEIETKKKSSLADNTKLLEEDIRTIQSNPGMKFSDRKKLNIYSEKSNFVQPPKEPEYKKYVPPSRKDRDNRGDRNGKKYTVYVSGFMNDFSKDEFFSILDKRIKIDRVTIPKTSDNKSKGYAFVDLNTKNDMESLIEHFNGMPYKHMILHANSKK